MLLSRVRRQNRRHVDIPASKALFIRKNLLKPIVEKVRGKPKVEREWVDLFKTRLPEDILKEAAFQGLAIEIHGALWQFCEKHPETLNFDHLELLPFHFCKTKYQKISPRYYYGHRGGEKTLVLIVSPSPQSVYQHCYFIGSYMDYISGSFENVVGVNYPELDERIIDITGLSSDMVKKRDLVVLGFAEELSKPMIEAIDCRFLTEAKGEHYYSKRYQLRGGQVINFLEVNYNFMGYNGARLMRRLVSLGTDTIVYCSRLRSSEGDKDDYVRLFSPERYILRSADAPVRYITDLSNPVAVKFQEIASGWHLSQDCLESQLEVSGIYCPCDISTYDHDLAFFAAAIEDANYELGKKTRFSPLHFSCNSGCVASTLQPLGPIVYDDCTEAFGLMRHYLMSFLGHRRK